MLTEKLLTWTLSINTNEKPFQLVNFTINTVSSFWFKRYILTSWLQSVIKRWHRILKMFFPTEILGLTWYMHISFDVASGSDITPCIKIDKRLVVYRFW